MLGREADRFEEALQGAAQGRQLDERLLPLVLTARAVSDLAGTPPPPPHGLQPGRQRLLTEAAQLQSESHDLRRTPVLGVGMGRLAAVLAVVILVLGLVFTAGTATAKSLPGGPLYGLKLAAEQVRMVLTTDPQAELDLILTLAEERLEEISTQMEQGQVPEPATVARLDQHLTAVLQAAVQVEGPETTESLQRLEISLQQRVRTTTRAMEGMPEQEQPQVRELVRIMERVRLEAQAGQEDPAGLRLRLRNGEPADPALSPGASRTPVGSPQPQQGGTCATERTQSSPSPTPCETCEPQGPGKVGPGAREIDNHSQRGTGQSGGPLGGTAAPEGGLPPRPTGEPGGVSPTEEPGSGPGPGRTDSLNGPSSAEPPGQGLGSGVQPTQTPVGPGSTGESNPGPQSPPAGQQGSPDPTGEPGSSPDPQSTDSPGDSDPPGQPGSGEGSPPPAGDGESNPPDPPGRAPDPQETQQGGGGEKGKP